MDRVKWCMKNCASKSSKEPLRLGSDRHYTQKGKQWLFLGANSRNRNLAPPWIRKEKGYEKTDDSMVVMCLYDIYGNTGNTVCRCDGRKSADPGRKQSGKKWSCRNADHGAGKWEWAGKWKIKWNRENWDGDCRGDRNSWNGANRGRENNRNRAKRGRRNNRNRAYRRDGDRRGNRNWGAGGDGKHRVDNGRTGTDRAGSYRWNFAFLCSRFL